MAETAAPENVWPGLVPVQQVIYRTPALHLLVSHGLVYASGCNLFLSVRAAVTDRAGQNRLGRLVTGHGEDGGSFLVEIEMDGEAIAADLDVASRRQFIFYRSSAAGSGQCWHLSYWMAPLPTVDFSLLVTAPSLGVPRSGVVLDGRLLSQRAADAEVLWPVERGEDSYQGLT